LGSAINHQKAIPYPSKDLKTMRPKNPFIGNQLLQISMPLGGIGTGCIGFNGQGGLQDFAIYNHPAFTVDYLGKAWDAAAFAVLHIKDSGTTRLIEGQYPPEKIYNLGLRSSGKLGGGHEGLPRFKHCEFAGEYPFGIAELHDETMPLSVRITGFNPFIPLDDKNSGIPCAILEYSLENTSSEAVGYQFSYHLSHLTPGTDARSGRNSRNQSIPNFGIYFYNEEPEGSSVFGSAALGVIGHTPLIQAMWFRGDWFDSLSTLWRHISSGEFHPNDGHRSNPPSGRNGGSLMLEGSLEPGETITYPIVITWFFPNVYYTCGCLENDSSSDDGSNPRIQQKDLTPAWHPYYVSQWNDAKEVLLYVQDNYNSLNKRSWAFHDALFNSTLPTYVLDAVSANLAIIKSPTILRQMNGNLWGWEGCHVDKGCCYGSCTHVWNYAQSIPHLFPALERTLREQELKRSMDERGHVNFRSALPDGPTSHDFHAAADGQLGSILKVYREWQISGDQVWLQDMVPLAQKSLDYCIEIWDPQHKGVLEEPHHNTYDIEFWGPDGMCTGIYLAALAAMAELLKDIGQADESRYYSELAVKGAEYVEKQLFNGEYYEQVVTTQGLRDTSFSKILTEIGDGGEIEEKLLKEEGPKYQYGSGCISDGVIGSWFALMCGVESPQSRENVRKNLKAIFEHNFKSDLSDHANTQRAGYALGAEPGLLLCTWPNGAKPTLPFIYSDEVWTGIEYQAASHMISEGLVDQGLTIVKATRSRYDGYVRNPWNEYECGSFYARAMASYGLLISLSGFQYSAVTKTLSLAPKLQLRPFKTFFSTATGFGTATLTPSRIEISLVEGKLHIERVRITINGKTTFIEPKIVVDSKKPRSIKIPVSG
jgi:uncharacterized protein (DUF608 family)